MSKRLVTVAVALTTLLAAAGRAQAQSSAPTTPGFELIVPSGTVMPTGAQGDAVRRGSLMAAQFSYGLRPDLVLTSTVGWTRSTPRGLGEDAKLHMFTYDAGVEYRLPRRSTDRRLSLKPFSGAGVGARTHHYRHAERATTHQLATYASVGAELGVSRVRLRLEVRDYLTWGGAFGEVRSARRNDVAVLAGLRLSLRAPR